jgi:copper(I)-binding protein
MRNTPYIKVPLLILLLLTSAFKTAIAGTSSLQIADAWIAEAPPTSKVLVAYMNIINPTDEEITLTSVKSAAFSSVEMHETVHEDGLARMVRHNSIVIPANNHILLERGGKHLMLFNPVERLKAGDNIELSLNTLKGDHINITIPVKKAKY